MRGRDLVSILDLTPDELGRLLDVALGMKRDGPGRLLEGQTLALLFEKPSLRTRVSFEQAMRRLGGSALYLSAPEVQMGEREPARDVARVIARMTQAIAARTFAHETVEEIARYADVPVINALTEREHPCQAIADLLTLRERLGALGGVRLAYVGEGNNVARSLAYASVLSGVDFVCASPEGYGLPGEVTEICRALPGGGRVEQTVDPGRAVSGAQAVYTDVWASMGFEHEMPQRLEIFRPYQLSEALLDHAPREALVMHDLPAHRGEEITDGAIESERSVVFDQAENRMHAQQAVLALLLADG